MRTVLGGSHRAYTYEVTGPIGPKFGSAWLILESLWYGSIYMADCNERITINPQQCGGRPCIRGMRIRVIDILDLYASGLTAQEILEEMPDLEMEDLTAALKYAAQRLDHPIIAA